MTADASLLLSTPEALDTRFDVGRLVAQGGMGQLYRGFDRQQQIAVAIKISLGHAGTHTNAALVRESQILAELDHPAVVAHIAHGLTDKQRAYLVMEWLQGSELRTRLRDRPLSESETIELGIQLCSALDAIHRRGITHRDITPGNILLLGNRLDSVKLIDFGLSVRSQDEFSGHTHRLEGTPGFMAPEQARGEVDCDPRTDLFSLGAVLYTCMVGRPPFTGDHPAAILAKTIFEVAPDVYQQRKDVSLGLNHLIATLLHTDRTQRPWSAVEVADQLRALRVSSYYPERSAAPIISLAEQRLFAVLMIDAPTLRTDHDGRQRVFAWADELGATIQSLAGGTLLAVFSAERDPTGMASNAAGLATRIAAERPSAAMAIATGRGQLAHSMPIGQVIDRAANMLFGGSETIPIEEGSLDARAAILLDDVTTQLVSGRFQVSPLTDGTYSLDYRLDPQQRDADAPLLGRTYETAELRAQFVACATDGRAAITAVIGAPGLGKSALAMHCLAHLQRSAIPSAQWLAFADATNTPTPFGVVRQLLCSAIGASCTDPPDTVRERLACYMLDRLPGDQFGRCVPFLGELLGAPFSSDDRLFLREARRDRRLMYEQMFRSFCSWLEVESTKRTLTLLVDDIHHCDSPSLEFLRRAMDSLRERPIWLLVLGQPSVTEKCPALWRHPALTVVTLAPLSEATCTQLARRRLPADASTEIITSAARRCAGNPLFLQLILRALERGRDDQMSTTVLAVVGSQIRDLAESHRQTLRAASVFGRSFTRAGVKELLQCSDQELDDALAVLVREQFIALATAVPGTGQREYRFSNEQIHGAAYATLIADDRARAHEWAAAFCERQPVIEPVVVATHYLRAQRQQRARPWLVRAARRALGANNPTLARQYAQTVVDSGADGAVLGRARQLLAESCNWCGEHIAALRNGQLAMALLDPTTEDWAKAAHQVSWAAGELGRFDEVLATADQLMTYLERHTRIAHAIALAWCACHLTNDGDTDKSEQIVMFLRARRAALGDSPSLDAALAHARATLALIIGLNGRSAAHFEQASRFWQLAGNQINACMDACNAAESLIMLGQYEVAEHTLRHHLKLAKQLQIEFLITGATLFLASNLIRTEAFAEAEALLSHLLASEDENQQRALILVTRARLALARGDVAAALADTEHVGGLDGFPHPRAVAQAIRAQALLAAARPQDALHAAEQGMRMLPKLRFIQDGDAQLRLIYARSLSAVGRHADARLALAHSRARLLARADMIQNREWRESFLTRVLENQQTLVLANALD